MRWGVSRTVAWSVALIALLAIPSLVVLVANEYPLNDGRGGNGMSGQRASEGTWTGGTIPDERSFIGWAQIHAETGKLHLPTDEAIQGGTPQAGLFAGEDASSSRIVSLRVEGANPSQRQAQPPGGPRQETDWTLVVQVRDGGGRPVADEPGVVEFEPSPMDRQAPQPRDTPSSWTTGADGTWRTPIRGPGSVEVAGVTLEIPIRPGPTLDVRPVPRPPGSVPSAQWELTVRVPDGYEVMGLSGDQLRVAWGTGPRVIAGVGSGSYDVPQLSHRVEHDGQQVYVNHWPAAVSLWLIPFWLAHLSWLATLLPFAGGVAAVAWLGHRFAGREGAIGAAGAVLLSGLAWNLVWHRAMGDLPSAAFAAIGMAVCVAAADRAVKGHPWPGTLALSAFGGAALGGAVLLRLTTVLTLFGVAAFLVVRFVQTHSTRGGATRLALATAPAVLVLAIGAAWLMTYNATFFGGPFEDGYAAQGNSFSSHVTPEASDVGHFFDVVAPRLLVAAPLLVLALPAALFARRQPDLAALAVGWGLPVAAFYAQMGWVGRGGWEDMRYFLPALWPTALLVGVACAPALRHRNARWAVLAAGGLFAAAAAWMLHLAVSVQLARFERGPPPEAGIPPALTLVAVAALVLLILALVWATVKRNPTPSPPEPAPRPARFTAMQQGSRAAATVAPGASRTRSVDERGAGDAGRPAPVSRAAKPGRP